MAPSLVLIAFAQLLHAFTFGTFHTAAVAYVNTKIPAERRGLGMAIYNAIGIGCASFPASVVGGYVVEALGYATLFVVFAAIPLVGVAAAVYQGTPRWYLRPMETAALLRELTEARGPSGYEEEVRRVVRARFAAHALDVRVDALGNCIARMPGHRGGPRGLAWRPCPRRRHRRHA